EQKIEKNPEEKSDERQAREMPAAGQHPHDAKPATRLDDELDSFFKKGIQIDDLIKNLDKKGKK
ncbi:MAG: hypothetical protein WAN36_01875, partial [Calditrichia bacterium]